MDEVPLTEAHLDELCEVVAEATAAFFGGGMRRYFELVNHADDFTLMGPFGGETVRDSANSDAQIDEMQRFVQGGKATLEIVERYASGNLAVLVVVEHQHGVVGGAPPQDWSLRITLVFRREGAGWRLVHRHADPLVHPITFEQLAALARGKA
jgi:ketosteroid isomerase-like protein